MGYISDEPWTIRDDFGDALEVYAVGGDEPRVGVNVPTGDPPCLNAAQLDKLIAELQRRRALFGEGPSNG